MVSGDELPEDEISMTVRGDILTDGVGVSFAGVILGVVTDGIGMEGTSTGGGLLLPVPLPEQKSVPIWHVDPLGQHLPIESLHGNQPLLQQAPVE